MLLIFLVFCVVSIVCLSLFRVVSIVCLSLFRVVSIVCLSLFRVVSIVCLSLFRVVSIVCLSLFRAVSIVCLSLFCVVCPMLYVSLDYLFLIALSIFCNIYFIPERRFLLYIIYLRFVLIVFK